MDNVTKTYLLGENKINGIVDVSLDINKGEFVSVIGPSGSGKTTLLNMIGCIDTPTEGTVEINGQCTRKMSDDSLSMLRGKSIGVIFQSFNLIPVFNVFENVEYQIVINKQKQKKHKEFVKDIIAKVGLEKHINHKPNELSGGQRQRVAIARALVHMPELVLADEPTANLDSKTSQDILSLMHDIKNSLGTTFIFSTHDPDVVQHAERIFALKDGSLRNYEN